MEQMESLAGLGVKLLAFVGSALAMCKMFLAYLEKRDLTIAGTFRDALKEALLQEGRHIAHEQTAETLRTKIQELKEEHAETRNDYKELRKTIEEGFAKTHSRIDKLMDSRKSALQE